MRLIYLVFLYTEHYGTTLALLILSNPICIFVYCNCGYSSHHRFTIFGASKKPKSAKGHQTWLTRRWINVGSRYLVFVIKFSVCQGMIINMFLLGLRKVSHLLNINWLYMSLYCFYLRSQAASTFDVHQVNGPRLAE